MQTRLQRWLSPPVFPDEEQTRIAGLLNLLLLALIGITVLDTALLLLFAPDTLPTFWINGVTVLGGGLLLWLMRRGAVRLAGVILCLTLWPLTVYYLAMSGGLASPALGLLSMFIVIGVTLFGARGALALGVVNIVGIGGLYLAGSHGLLASSEGPPSLARLFVTNSVLFAGLAAFLAISGRSVYQALIRARQGGCALEDRNSELQNEIAERKQVEAALRASEAQYRLLFNGINDAVFVSGLTDEGKPGLFTQVNDVACQRLGYTREELLALSPQAIGAPDQTDDLPAVMERLVTTKRVLWETEQIAKDGSRLPVEINAHLFQVNDHPVVLSIARDIAERKRVEDALRASEERYRIITELMSDYAFFYRVEPDGALINEWSTGDSFTRLTGFPPEEIGATFIGYQPSPYHLEDFERRVDDLQTTLQGTPTSGEYRIVTKSGAIRWINLHRHPIWDSDHERVVALYGAARDITERKRLEETQRESEERYRIISEMISDYAFCNRVEPDGTLVTEWETDLFRRLTGYAVAEMTSNLAQRRFTFFHPDDQAQMDLDTSLLLQGEPTDNDYRIIMKNGATRWIHLYRQPAWDNAQQRVTRYYGVAQDVTERKRAEEQISGLLNLQTAILDNAAYAVISTDAAGTITSFNTAAERMLGYQAAEVIGKLTPTVFHDPAELVERAQQYSVELDEPIAADFAALVARARRHLANELEWTYIRRDGSHFPVLVSVTALQDAQGETSGFLGIANNITERQQAEQKLKESEAKYRNLVENSLEGIGLSRGDQILFANQALLTMFGYETVEEFSRISLLEHVAPESRAAILAIRDRRRQGDPAPAQFSYKIVKKDGEIRDLEILTVEVVSDGEPIAQSTFRDITERKQAEAELQRRDAILEAVSLASGRLLKASDWRQEITNVLGTLGEVDGAEAVTLFQFYTDGQDLTRASLRYEWDPPGISSQTDNSLLQNIDLLGKGFGPLLERLAQKQAVSYHTKDAQPGALVIDPALGTRSVLLVPVLQHGALWGSLAFSTLRQEREWSKAEIEALQIAADLLGTVMERKEAEDALQQVASRLKTLHQIDRAILAVASPEEIALAALRRIRQVIPCQRATIAVFDFETQERVVLAADTNGEPVESVHARYPLDERRIETFHQEQAYVIPDLRSLPDPSPALQDLLNNGLTSLAAVPLIVQERLLGSLDLVAAKPDTFTEEHLDIAREVADQLAIAIQQGRLLETERDQRTLAEALRDSAAAISSTLELDDVLQRILINVERVVPHEAAHIMLLKDGVARVVCARGWAERGLGGWISQVSFVFDEMPKWRQFFTGQRPQAYAVADTRADPDWVMFSESQWVRSTAAAPIYSGGQLIGLLHLDSATPGFFTQAQLDHLQTFAQQAALAIHNAQLFQAEQQRRRIAETLVQAAALLGSTLELNQVLDLILMQLQDVIDYDSASIQQLENNALVVIACHGFENPAGVTGLQFPLIAKFPNTRVIMEQTPLAFADIVQEYPHFQQEASSYQSASIHAWLGLPLLSKGATIGMITLDRVEARPFSAEDRALATAFASQAAVAIENARLYEQAQRQSAELEQRVKERTAQLEAANEELHTLSRVKDEFVSNVSHELRTPITNINLRHFLLAKQPEKLAVHLPVLQRETTRLARIIDDLLTLSRMDQDRATFKLTEVDLSALVRQFVTDRVSLAENRGLVLGAECIPAPLPVQVDAGLLEQALSVLLTNALNYTPPGGHVLVSTQMQRFDDRRWVGFSVSDTGPGIQAEEQRKLFTRFFRGEAGRASRVAGTGLGLALAQEIVARHHGRITVESEGAPGRGATFTVWLPAITAEPATT